MPAVFNWDDLRHLLAVAQHGSTLSAARALGVSQSTVQRRLRALDDALGRSLTVRTASGYALTDYGAALLPAAQAVEEAAKRFTGVAREARDRVSGLIRVTCPEPIIPRLMPLIERFQQTHPDLQVEFVTSDRYLDLARGDADVAFRSGDTDADLVGRKVADSIWSVYASAGYVERRGRPRDVADLASHALVTLDAGMAGHRVVAWLDEVAPHAPRVARVNSILGLLQSVRSGAGVAPLPANIADADPTLVRLFGPVPALTRSWKLLTTRALRREPRIAAFFDYVAAAEAAVRSILN
ncbi:transcriptional regulator, LysR family [Sphingomonas guangdongensis]|uniref:Transcriptional regulator, LysR family n=1 Tax=Sphingomonas guangdongensis TaxID=1141890 RepID=A0A285QXA7_9SPHN|nr:LysR family transcriptional regulator [Sphingomonas guangdongensis]SOB86605.1 transcriptional regulator, LysR family [Sphingomonas guangdongensis]